MPHFLAPQNTCSFSVSGTNLAKVIIGKIVIRKRFKSNLKNMDGTDSIETMTRMSRLQPISSEMISILLREGSSGNSTIFRPRLVSLPVLSNAPKIHN